MIPREMNVPRFYFDTFDGQEWIRDEAGVECPTSEMAIKEAQETLPEIVQEEWPSGQAPTIWVRIKRRQGTSEPH